MQISFQMASVFEQEGVFTIVDLRDRRSHEFLFELGSQVMLSCFFFCLLVEDDLFNHFLLYFLLDFALIESHFLIELTLNLFQLAPAVVFSILSIF